jgi:transposase
MRVLKFNDPEKIKNEIKKEISNIKDGRYVRRLDAILLIAEGRNAYEVAEIFGYSPRSIHGWIKTIEKTGNFIALKDNRHTGRPCSLNETQKNELRAAISNPPSASGHGYSRWDGKLLSAHITDNYGVTLGTRRCQKLFHELGFSYRRPRKMAHGGSQEAKDDFKKT